MVDCSPGGLGLQISVFLPRKCRAVIQIADFFRAKLRVRRVVMADRQPSYYIGCSFEERSDEFDRAISDLLRRARAQRQQEGAA